MITVFLLSFLVSQIFTTSTQHGKFLHITDIHIDPYYLTGALVGEACHKIPDLEDIFSANNVTTSFSDNERNEKDDVTTFGRHKRARKYHNLAGQFGASDSGCDSPMTLIEESFRFIKNKLTDVDFVLWTGDNARHDNDDNNQRTYTEIKNVNNLALQYILESLTPYGKKHINIPIIPSIGNNDVYPHNSLLWIDHKRPGKNKRNSVLEFYAALWDIFIPHSQMKTFKRGGYFFVEISEKLVIVSLNTMYWFEKNVFVGDCKKKERTAGGVHLTWLEKEVLIPARKSGKKVLLSGHIAPSSPLNFFPKCLKWYTVLTYEYNDVIIGQVYGHNNIDHFFFPLTKKDYSLNIRSSTPVSDYFFLGNDVDPFSTLSFQDTSNEYTIDSVLDNHNNKPHKPCFPDCGAGWIPEYIEFLLRHYKEISKEKTVLKPIFVSPSVVPAFNPALRVFYYNNINTVKDEKKSVDFQILYYDQYFVNLTYWNSLSQSKLESLLGYEKHKRSWRKRTGGDHLFEIEYRSSESFKTSVEIDNPGYWKKFGERLGGASGSENKKQVLELRKMWLHFLTVGLIAEEEKEK